MKMFKKTVSILLALILVISVFAVLPITASADGTKTIRVGIINYFLNPSDGGYIGSDGWQVHYWGGTAGDGDADLADTGIDIDHSVGYWGSAQSFSVFSAAIPDDATGFCIHKGDRWFNENGSSNGNAATQDVAYVFNYSGDHVMYAAYIEAGYYIVGTMTGWDFDSDYILTANSDVEGDYYFTGLDLETTDEFKIRYTNGFDGGAWYPSDGSNYGANGEITVAAKNNVYFRSAGGVDGWYSGYFRVDRSAFTSHSISLNGTIGVNFYLNLNPDQADDASVAFAWSGKSDHELVAAPVWDNDKGRYKVTCPVAPAEMTAEITATLSIGGVETAVDTFSAKTYADTIIAGAYADNLKNLVKAMLDYGTAAQLKFDVNTGTLANGGTFYFTADPDVSTITTTPDTPDYTSVDFWEYEGSSVVCLSTTSIRHYFIGAPKSFYEQKGIEAANLDKQYTVTVDGANYTYSVLDYVKKAWDNPAVSMETQQICKALYYYSQMAEAYFV